MNNSSIFNEIKGLFAFGVFIFFLLLPMFWQRFKNWISSFFTSETSPERSSSSTHAHRGPTATDTTEGRFRVLNSMAEHIWADTVRMDRCYAFGLREQEVVGQNIQFYVQFVTRSGKPCHSPEYNARAPSLHIDIDGAAPLVAKQRTDQETGVVTVEFSARQSGDYSINIKGDGRSIANSPLHVTVLPGPIDGSRCELEPTTDISRKPQLIDQELRLKLIARDSFDNQRISGGDGDLFFVKDLTTEKIIQTKHIKDDQNGEYILTLSFNQSGVFRIGILYVDAQILNGEFEVCVLSEKDMNMVEDGLRNNKIMFSKNISCGSIDHSSKLYFRITPAQVTFLKYRLIFLAKHLYSIGMKELKFSYQHHPQDSRFDTIELNDGFFSSVEFSSGQLLLIYASLLSFKYSSTQTKSFAQKKQFLANHLNPNESLKHIFIDRQNILSSAYKEMHNMSINHWHQTFCIQFEGECGIDAGGLRREFFLILAKALFTPDSSTDRTDFHIFDYVDENAQNTAIHFKYIAKPNKRQLDLAKFAGKFLAKCIYETSCRFNILINIPFARSFYKAIILMPINQDDVETDYPSLFEGKVRYFLDHPMEELDEYIGESYFTDEEVISGEPVDVPLKKGGESIRVTDDNKKEYIQLLTDYRLRQRHLPLIEAFREGFYSLIEEDLISIFNESELELLLCGLPEIDVEDFKANSTDSLDSTLSRWFWIAVANFTSEERAKLLQFITGSSQLPLGGFKALKPRVSITGVVVRDVLPAAHTCANNIEIPRYSSYEKLWSSLQTAIYEGLEGFGMA
eukprot:gb/GECH01008347.1/.p1 GENE.gb/GECH01008347.1/~~gb/GECH01008347.1/.p1  ORF type:complete len:797 (+),score=152.07 gb/GECH01008347.1/:1-2391(+)